MHNVGLSLRHLQLGLVYSNAIIRPPWSVNDSLLLTSAVMQLQDSAASD